MGYSAKISICYGVFIFWQFATHPVTKGTVAKIRIIFRTMLPGFLDLRRIDRSGYQMHFIFEIFTFGINDRHILTTFLLSEFNFLLIEYGIFVNDPLCCGVKTIGSGFSPVRAIRVGSLSIPESWMKCERLQFVQG
jgi:hypothetical protein